MFVALSTRLWFLQVLAGPQHDRDARDNSLRTVVTDALRGDIVDAQAGGWSATGSASRCGSTATSWGTIARRRRDPLSILVSPPSDLGEVLDTSSTTATNRSRSRSSCPRRSTSRSARNPRSSRGSRSSSTSVRSYPRVLAAHLVGWSRPDRCRGAERPAVPGYGPSDLVGKAGVEATYERWQRRAGRSASS